MNVIVARYLLGVGSLCVVCVSLAVAAVALRRRLLPEWSGAPARLAEAIAGLALLIAILELLGAIGLFRLAPIVVACALAGLAGGSAVARGRLARRSPRAPSGLVATGAALLAGALVLSVWASPTLESYDLGMHAFDTLWYHLPWAASFAQTGRVTSLHYDLEFLLAFYPATAELFHGLGIVLLGRDTLSPVLNLLWMGLALLAGWCIGRPRGRGAASTAGVALVLLTPMMDFSQPGSADGDIVGLAFLLGAVALVVNAERRTAAYALAGLSAGFAASIKLTFLAPVGLLTLGVLAIAIRDRGATATPGPHRDTATPGPDRATATPARRATALAWLVPLVLAGGFWYARNLIAVGNPLPWTGFAGLLPTPAPPLQQHVSLTVAHYLTSSVFWKHFFVTGMAGQLGPWWYVIGAVAIVGPLLCLLPRAGGMVRMVALVALASLAAYLVTPNGAIGPDGYPIGFTYNLRYAAPGLALAFAVMPLSPVLAGPRSQAVVVAGLAVVAVATVAQSSLWPAQHLAGALLAGGVVLAVGLAIAVRPVRGKRPTRAVALAALALLACAGAAAGYPWQRHYLRGRYTYQPSISHLSGVWDYFRTIHHVRVAVAGTYGEFFSYPLFGIDDSNRVQYIARTGTHGSFTPLRTCAAWRAAVNRGHFQYLLTTPERDVWHPAQLTPAPERKWALGDPGVHLLFERRVTGQPVDLFSVSGALNPAACPRTG